MKLVVLASGEGTNLQAVLDAIASGALRAELRCVVSQRQGAGALRRADEAEVSTAWVPLKAHLEGGGTRESYDADLARLVGTFEPDWVVCLGWMHVLSAAFLDVFPERVINLHPALPGELPGKDSLVRAWEEGQAGLRTRTGLMVHHVVTEVDAGPPLATVEVALRPGESLEAFAERMHAAEHGLIVDVLVALSGEGTMGDS